MKKTPSWPQPQKHKKGRHRPEHNTVEENAWSSPTRFAVAKATRKSTFLVRFPKEERWRGSKKKEERYRKTNDKSQAGGRSVRGGAYTLKE